MSVTIQEVERVAALAHLSFTETEKETLTHELNEILTYMEQLNTLDTEHAEPLAHVIQLSNVFREDALRPTLHREEALKNAPAKSDEFFTVPKVIAER